MATYYRTGVETYSIIGAADEMGSLEGRIPDGSTYFAVDENMFYTFYDGTWYETLPEAARLYHDDVGTDTRPIKLVGGVATVVANELAEDSKVVHNTGDETISGNKVLQGILSLSRTSEPILNLKSGIVYTTDGFRSEITTTDIKDNAETRLTQVISRVQPTSSQYDVRVYKPDRSGFYDMDLRSYSDHFAILVPTYYPVDGSSNPQALTANALVSSGNVAVDPRIVHTTMNETIAGNKTFTGYTFIDRPRVKMSDHYLTAGEWRKYYEYTPVSYGGYAIFSVIQTYYVYAWRNAEIRIRQGSNESTSNPDGNMYGFSSTLLGCLAKRTDGVVEIWLNNPSANNSIGVRLSVVSESGGDIKVSQETGSKPVVGSTYTYVYDMPQN